jgi:hypothetical protein
MQEASFNVLAPCGKILLPNMIACGTQKLFLGSCIKAIPE